MYQSLESWSHLEAIPANCPHLFYFAGPFFNAEQRAIISGIEKRFEEKGVHYFSPRKQHADIGVAPITTIEGAKKAFQLNVNAINACTALLAVLDYAMPQGQNVCIIDGNVPTVDANPIMLPDTGTVWEMGYGHARACSGDITMWGFSCLKQTKLNIMLSQSVCGILRGMDRELRGFLDEVIKYPMQPSRWAGWAEVWKGDHE